MNVSMKLVSFYSKKLSKISLHQRSQLVTSVLPRPLVMDPAPNDQHYNRPEVKPVSKILNTDIDVSLDVLRKEFSKVGRGAFELIKDDDTGIALLTINNVERRNSLSGLMMAQFDEVLTRLEEWQEGKAVIIQGKDGFFCSGGDLTTVKEIATHEGGRQMGLLMQDNLKRLERLPLITVAVVQGKAIGGGAEICTAADFRLMTHSAEIGFVHIRMGITAGWGGGSRLVQLVGPTKALDLMSTGKRLTADQALEAGLISDILLCDEEDDVINKSRDWLKPYISGACEPLKAIKNIVTAAKLLPIEEALKMELEIFSSVWGGPAHKRAMTQNVKHK